MPAYTNEITLPPKSDQVTSVIVVMRYYAPFGDGSPDGWEIPVPPPAIKLNGHPRKVGLIFSAVSVNTGGYTPITYIDGQRDGGYDQHAQVYAASVDLNDKEQKLTVSGTFQLVGYFSVVLYYANFADSQPWKSQTSIMDKEMATSPEGSNPYHIGNPSVFAYQTPLLTTSTIDHNEIGLLSFFRNIKSPAALKSEKAVSADNNSVGLYRPDQFSSKTRMLENIGPDGCSTSYLVTDSPPPMYEVYILRIKVPVVFIQNADPDLIFGDYQCRYLSVNANIPGTQTPVLDFWTVDSRMLNNYKDKDGYAYVFFAPTDYTQRQAKTQGTPPKTPPVMSWGNYKGYLLGHPDYAIIIRYRDPNLTWEGNPENATCYPTPDTNKPVQSGELGEYTPEIFGDSLSNFESGKIGPVDKNGGWPTV